MPTRLVEVAVDSADPGRLARFWAAALGWEIAVEEPGAVPADIGQGVQGEVPWTVLADPEGHEFCVPSPRGGPP